MKVLGADTRCGDGIENEDVYGYSGDVAWVIDGATDLFDLNLFECKDDVAYYVRNLSACLERNSGLDISLQEMLQRAIQETNELCGLRVGQQQVYKLPSFAISIIRLSNGICEYYVLGDCTVLIYDDEIIKVRDNRISEFSKHNREQLRQLRQDGLLSAENEKLVYQKTRMYMNSNEGYWIGSVDSAGLKYAVTGQKSISKDARVLLFSDGLLEAFELFKIAQVDEKLFSNERLQEVVEELRKQQKMDAARKITRVRKADDVTYVLVR